MRMFAWGPACAVVLLTGLPVTMQAQEKSKLKPKDIPRLMEEADKFIAANDLPKAEAYLKAIIELDPKQAQAAYKLGTVCESQKDWDCTMMNYQLALGALTGAEKARAHLGLATGHFQAGRYTDAAEQASAVLAIDPARAEAHVIRAQSLVKVKSPEAVAACEAAAKAVPTNAAVHAALGEALIAAGRQADAEAPLKKALELEPKRPATSAQLAQVLEAKGDHAGAIAAATAALDAEPGRKELYAVRGRAYLATGDEAKALGDLYAAVAANPQDKVLLLALAKIQQKQGRLPEAAQQYRAVLAIDPRQPEALLGLADSLVRVNDFENAKAPAAAAAAALPDNAQAQYLHGRLLEQDKQYDPALTAYGNAVRLDPKLSQAYYGQGRILREQKKDVPGALAAMEKAAALDGADPGILTELGAVLYESKQVDRTIETLTKATASTGYANPMGYAVLGLALKDKKEFDKAIPSLEKAGELAPKWWMPRWGAAWSYFGGFKKGCPCGPEDQAKVQKMQAHYDQMLALGGTDAALGERVKMLSSGLKIK
ncbi:tetratricopeptide repeat protein [Luteitalea sp.]|jgi:tetratricopeptide (TPR) repeat protein|uniref:tetratricopeptide repeat protein n=1 Tax=Luteitalea sp. TaxID=2004800 RepID=UPI0037CADFAC